METQNTSPMEIFEKRKKREEGRRESLRSLTVTSWHESIKERISPQIEAVGVPIFHQPSAGCKCWGKRKKARSFTPPGPLERCGVYTSFRLFFSVQERDCSSASRTR